MNLVFYVDAQGVGFGYENPDEPTKAGYGFFRDPETRKIMLWVETDLPEAKAVKFTHGLRKQLLKKRQWGINP
ncbi:MAG TPA: hypothetical protein VI728_11105 [Syntrophales bacterium]|nr:hypothetical protein [Syntrophales bacterium]